jgi:DNA-directed RNA polymerase specialized sigma24 family protein
MSRRRDQIPTTVLDRARAGDREAFTALIRHYDPGLRALAYRLLGDRERMDDALQEPT